MEHIEKLIKTCLEKDLAGMATKTADCPDEQTILDYLWQRLESPQRAMIESHLAHCGFCLSQLGLALEAGKAFRKKRLPQPPREAIEKAKALVAAGSAKGGRGANKKRIIKNLYLIGAILFFILSFLIPRYFIQFLVATLILGIRWAFESEGGRTLIMMLDSRHRRTRQDDEEISQRPKRRF